MNVDAKQFKAVQLREWCSALGLPADGTKADMVLRLNEIPAEQRGVPPAANSVQIQNNVPNEPAQEPSGADPDNENYISAAESEVDTDGDNVEAELNLIKYERDLLLKEINLLKKKCESTNEKTSKMEHVVDAAAGNSIPLNIIKDMIPDYDDGSHFDFWEAQVRSLREVYKVNENTMRALITVKLSGKALKWLHSNLVCATCNFEELLCLMKSAFGLRENKLVRRKNFEERKWLSGETFSEYYSEKTIMAAGLHVDKEDMIDYVIDGIPSKHLREQAQLQCFDNETQLLKAFAKIGWSSDENDAKKTTTASKAIRCYNCNALGHYATACLKPKRQYGACYGCGKTDHQVVNCPDRKTPAKFPEGNEYVRLFKYIFKSEINYAPYLETLIDSGSPVSFLRRSKLPQNLISNFLCSKMSNYIGINKSKLEFFGKICCVVIHKNAQCNVKLLVVPDKSMGYDVVLGRDFLRESNSKLVLGFENNNIKCDKNMILVNCEMIDAEKNDRLGIIEVTENDSNKMIESKEISCEKLIETKKNDCVKMIETKENDYVEMIETKKNYCVKMIETEENDYVKMFETKKNDCVKMVETKENACVKMIDKIIKNESCIEVIDKASTKNNCVEILNERNEVNVKVFTSKNKCNEKDMKNKHIDFNDNLLATIYDVDDKQDLIIGKNVCWKDKQKLVELFEKWYVRPERPENPLIKCEMKILLNDAKPFSYNARRISYTEKIELQKIIDDYLEKGYIKASESEYASPILLVKKKTGELRMCIDFRKLNEHTAKDNYPLPLIDDLLDRLAGKKYFTKLDLKNGFFHVFMSQESVKYTSFVTPLGQFEFLRMPIGVKNAPSMFQRFVNKVFADLVKEDKVIVYMDDIMIASENLENHMAVLKEVFEKLVENRLELRIDKCEFLQSEIKYLGYTISEKGIGPDEKGLEAIRNFSIPDKVRTVQSFLGLCSYFCRFVKNFSILAKPLYDLTRKDAVFKFGSKELECFELLKSKLLKAPILSIYDPSRETELHTDASSSGFGAILLQKKEDGKLHPIFYFSKRTTELESHYHSFELETLAIVYALKRFRIYLLGKKFKIMTDCNSLTQTLSRKELNPRIERWALEL